MIAFSQDRITMSSNLEKSVCIFSGSDVGLQLIINIEQYEYVSIRSKDAGIKVRVY